MKIVVFLIPPKPHYTVVLYGQWQPTTARILDRTVFLPVSHHVNDVTSVTWQDLKSLYPR